jgi:Bacteriocin-protection, YdeI or OmpD-Associated
MRLDRAKCTYAGGVRYPRASPDRWVAVTQASMVIGLALTRCRGPVSSSRVPGGAMHKLPGDLRNAVIANPTAFDAWKDITPLARNEFICWVEDAKQEMTRERRIRGTQEKLEEGRRRPCCWPGCKHRERTGR